LILIGSARDCRRGGGGGGFGLRDESREWTRAHLGRARGGEVHRAHVARSGNRGVVHPARAGRPASGAPDSRARGRVAQSRRFFVVASQLERASGKENASPQGRHELGIRTHPLGSRVGMAPAHPDPEPRAETREASTSSQRYASPGMMAACLAVIPNAALWWGLSRGRNKLETLVTGALRVGGIPALLAIPFLGMSMEKCFYDTLVSMQGCDPTYVPPERRGDAFPSGGHALPSFSLVPVRHVSEYVEYFSPGATRSPPR